jgi:cell division septation protein DedD
VVDDADLGDGAVPVQALLEVLRLPCELGGRAAQGDHQLAVVPELDEPLRRVGRPLHVEDEVVPDAALQRRVPDGVVVDRQPEVLAVDVRTPTAGEPLLPGVVATG